MYNKRIRSVLRCVEITVKHGKYKKWDRLHFIHMIISGQKQACEFVRDGKRWLNAKAQKKESE